MILFRSIVIVAMIAATNVRAQSSGGSQSEPLGLFGSVEFTDIRTRDDGGGLFSKQAWLGTYWKPTKTITTLVAASYGKNDLDSGEGEVEATTVSAAMTWDIFTFWRPYDLTFFILGEVGASATSITAEPSVTSFLSAAGAGLKVKATPGTFAIHLRVTDAGEFQKWAIGFSYGIPFDLHPDPN